MKVTVKKVSAAGEEEAVIKASEITDSIAAAIGLLESGDRQLICIKDGENIPCPFSKIYYIESLDDRTFVYTREQCLEVRLRLYELESMLDYRFFRCSKSMICNVRKIKGVRAIEGAKMEASLLNDEKILISRSYVKELKKRLGL